MRLVVLAAFQIVPVINYRSLPGTPEAMLHQDAASGLVARTVLYGLPNTNTFEVRQMIRSNSTNVRIP